MSFDWGFLKPMGSVSSVVSQVRDLWNAGANWWIFHIRVIEGILCSPAGQPESANISWWSWKCLDFAFCCCLSWSCYMRFHSTRYCTQFLCSQYSVLQVIMYFPVSFLFYLRNYSSTVGCFWCPDWMPINGHAPTSVRPRDKSLGISRILRSSFQHRWLKETGCVCQETLSKCRRGKEWGCAQPIPILYCWYSNIESILVVWYCLPLLRSRAVSTSILQDCFGSLTLFFHSRGPIIFLPGMLSFSRSPSTNACPQLHGRRGDGLSSGRRTERSINSSWQSTLMQCRYFFVRNEAKVYDPC